MGSLRDLFPDRPAAPTVGQTQEAGVIPFRMDRPPLKREVVAAMQPDEQSCACGPWGGACQKHGLNAFLVGGHKAVITQHGDGRTSVDFSRTDERELEKRMQLAEQIYDSMTMPPPEPLDTTALANAVYAIAADQTRLAHELWQLDQAQTAEIQARIAALEGRVG